MTEKKDILEKVAIVIVTWNKRDDVINLLDSLSTILTTNHTIIVVDNASTDGSIEAIIKHPLKVTLLANENNLGGTGGFHTGIQHILDTYQHDYIWLLDNDAEVTNDTLEAMVQVMEADRSIGAAGSCILSPSDKSLIVEAGGFIDYKTLTWKPNLRYQRFEQLSSSMNVFDVDYIPACSALVRTKIFLEIGSLDTRFFLHWDDVDFFQRVRSAGYRVVSALGSKVYHGAEKGYSPSILYYDIRNSLLFAAKHLKGIRLYFALSRVLFRSYTAAIIFYLQDQIQLSWHIFSSINDFLNGSFGPIRFLPESVQTKVQRWKAAENKLLSYGNKVIIFAVGSQTEIEAAVRKLVKLRPSIKITLAVPSERSGAYHSNPAIENIISYDLASEAIGKRIKGAYRFLCSGYDYGVSAGVHFVVPYAFLLKRNVVYDGTKDTFFISSVSLATSWKPFISALGGLLMMLLKLCPSALSATKIHNEKYGA